MRLAPCGFVLLVLVAPSVGARARHWSKHHQEIAGHGATPVVAWTTVYTNDELAPYVERVLYRDELDHRLVIRTERTRDPDAPGLTTIENVSTGELVRFEVQHRDTFVVTSPGHQVSAGRDALAALRPDGGDFPDEIEAQAAVLMGSLSEGFREALHGLAQNGCSRAVDLFSVAKRAGLLFFDDVPCGSAPPDSPTPTDWVVDFDPAKAPAGEFEQAFGAAYGE